MNCVALNSIEYDDGHASISFIDFLERRPDGALFVLRQYHLGATNGKKRQGAEDRGFHCGSTVPVMYIRYWIGKNDITAQKLGKECRCGERRARLGNGLKGVTVMNVLSNISTRRTNDVENDGDSQRGK